MRQRVAILFFSVTAVGFSWLLACGPPAPASKDSETKAAVTKRAETKPAGTKPGRPNVLFILSDDAGFGDFDFTGHPYAKTPAIARLAEQGTVFEEFYVGGATCSPSRTAFMTGRPMASFQKYPTQYGFGDVVTVTEILHRSGYRTGHFGKWHIGPERKNGTYAIDDIKVSGAHRRDPRGRDAATAANVVRFLRAHKDGPFYLNVWLRTPHNPIEPPQPFVDRFRDVVVRPEDFAGTELQAQLVAMKASGVDIDDGMRKYLGDISQMDDQVEHMLAALDELGLSESTLVVFTSDNGPAGFGSAGPYHEGKHSFYDGGIHLPLIVRWPGHVPAGRVDKTSVIGAFDWLPTLSRLAGAELDPHDAEGLVGEDVSDIWLGAERERRTDLLWRKSDPREPAVIRRGHWKLHRSWEGALELYDLATDPGEHTNVADREPAVARELEEALTRWTATLPQTYIRDEGYEDDI